ncbi:MAG: cupin domain-containing protein [Synechococcaceae cyanobacterium]|nr:cupin domain-containing protein [Synechococcaceae cyanobacterium]
MACPPLLRPRLVQPEELIAYRFHGEDHCRLALLSDPAPGQEGPTLLMEIHDPGDRVPPHRHRHSAELFVLLRGQLLFHVEQQSLRAVGGDTVVVPQGSLHAYENPGPERAYLLTLVSSDDGFAASVRAGIPTPLDAEDLRVLRNL